MYVLVMLILLVMVRDYLNHLTHYLRLLVIQFFVALDINKVGFSYFSWLK